MWLEGEGRENPGNVKIKFGLGSCISIGGNLRIMTSID